MTSVWRKRERRLREEQGQGLVEYALILALVSLAAIVALGFLSGKINTLFSKAGNSLNTVAVADGGGTGGTATGGTATGGTATGGTATGGGPVINITQQPLDPSSSTSATFQFTSTPAGTSYVCAVSGGGGSSGACNANTPINYTGLANGSHTFTVTPTPAGTPDSYTWTINAGTPPTPGSVSISCSVVQSGDCKDDGTATANPGTWGGNPAPTFTYQWAHNTDSNASCTGGGWNNVGTTQTINLPNINGTDQIRVIVTGSNGVGSPVAAPAVCRDFED